MKSGKKNPEIQDTHSADATGANAAPAKLYVNVLLQGEEVIRFLEHKRIKFLRSNSEVGRSLMLERLNELTPAA
jgi:hypothetical protein